MTPKEDTNKPLQSGSKAGNRQEKCIASYFSKYKEAHLNSRYVVVIQSGYSNDIKQTLFHNMGSESAAGPSKTPSLRS